MVNYWPHLNTIHEKRGQAYAEILKNYSGHVVDLNCGLAPVFKFLQNYDSYYGNDILPEFIDSLKGFNSSKVLFELKRDSEVVIDKCDILILLGLVYGSWANSHSCESPHAITKFKEIIEKSKPQIAILENADEVKESTLENYIQEIQCLGYSCTKKEFDFHKGGRFMQRTLWKFVRNE